MITKRIQCTGCTACMAVCPKDCITMIDDKEGFCYPYVNMDDCVDCGLCNAVCPLENCTVSKDDFLDEHVVYGGYINETGLLADSSSGGFFSVIAKYIINENGVVYGCALNDDNIAYHIRVECIEDLEKLRGSKYVQSNICGTFDSIAEDLRNGKKVLFTGTPCECAGLYNFCKISKIKNIDNLFVCDFICHGVPSPAVFKAYINNIENKHKFKVISFKFRNKDYGWHASGLQLGTRIEADDGTVIRNYPAYKDPYMNGFLEDLFLRPSCYDCFIKNNDAYCSDITIADFWGVNKINKNIYNREGTSLVIMNSNKGEKLFQCVKDEFYCELCDYDSVANSNKSIKKSAPVNNRRSMFFCDFISGVEFSKLEKKYMTVFHWLIHKVAGIIWNTFKKVIHAVFGFVLDFLGIKWSEKYWNSFFQFVKFCIVGVSNVAVSYFINVCVLLLQRPLKITYDYIIANTVAFIIAVLWSFYWNSGYVFKENNGEKRSKGKTLLKTYLTYAFSGIFLNNVLGTIWIKILHISKYMAPLLNVPFTVPVNFLLNKFWTFRNKSTGDSI